MLAVTTVLALGVGAFIAERHESVAPLQTAVALQPPGDTNIRREANDEPVVFQESPQAPGNLFLPDTYLMTNFEDSTGEPSWHSYDSWWNSNS